MKYPFIVPFIEATSKVLNVQMGIQVKFDKPVLRESYVISEEVVAGIDINSKTFNGNLLLIFPRQTLLVMMSALLGDSITELNPETEEGAAELLNMIFGQAKIVLNQQDHDIKMAFPAVKKSSADKAIHLEKLILVPLHSSGGDFYMGFTQGF